MSRLHAVFTLFLWASVSLGAATASSSSWSSSEDETPQSNLVSPIVNRELEAAVVAHSWPTTPQSVFCEAFVYHNSQDDNNQGAVFLERLVELLNEATTVQDDMSYQNATALVLEASPLSVAAKRLFQFALSMRASSPACEVYRGLARETLRQAGLLQTTKAVDAFAVVHPGGKVLQQEALLSFDWSSIVAAGTADDETLLLPDEKSIGGSDNGGGGEPLVIVYANLGSASFVHVFHRLVDSKVRFVVRHLGAVHFEEDPTSAIETTLQGYGVRLDIRNVEYKVFDDRSDKQGGMEGTGLVNLTAPDLEGPPQYLAGVNLTALGLENNRTTLASLWRAHDGQQAQSQILPPVWQRRQLPLQAAAVIAASRDPLATLQEVSQDLPSVASTLAYVKIPEDIQKMAEGLEKQYKLFRPGRLYINGRVTSLSSPTFNVFVLLNLMREEQAALDGMQAMLGSHLEPAALKAVQRAWMMGDKFLQSGTDDESQDGEDSTVDTAFRVDVGRGGKRAIMYLNNVEKDRQYAQWPTSLQQMLMSMQFGMPPAVRKNIFTVLAVIDPIARPANIGFDIGLQMMDRSLPIRIGAVLVTEKDVKACAEWLYANEVEDDMACPVAPLFEAKSKPTKEAFKTLPANAQAVHRLFSEFSADYSDDPGASLAYLEYLLASIDRHKSTSSNVFMSDLLTMHGDLLEAMRITTSSKAEADAFDTLTQGEDTGDSEAYLYGHALRFAAEKAVTPGMSFLNGRPLPVDEAEDDDAASTLFADEQKYVFGLIAKKEITDNNPKSIYVKLLTGARVFKKCHPLLVGGNENGDSYMQVDHQFGVESLIFPEVENSEPEANFVVEALIELDTKEGIQHLSSLLPVLDSFVSSLDAESSSSAVRFGYRIMPSTPSAAATALCPILAQAGLLGTDSIAAAITKASLADKVDALKLEDMLSSLPGLTAGLREAILAGSIDGPCSSSQYLSKELPSTKNFILGNGRFYSIDSDAIKQEDIELLMAMEVPRAKATTGLLKEFVSSFDAPVRFDAVTRAATYLAIAESQSVVDRLSLDQLVIELEEKLAIEANPLRISWNTYSDNSVKVHVVVVIDPLSEAAQRLSSLLRVMRDHLNFSMTVILTPATLIDGESDVPITSYYRFVADTNAMPDTATPKAGFSDLPAEHLLTLRMDVPEPWDVQQTVAIQDTDNLRCDLKSGCSDDAYASDIDDDWITSQQSRHLTEVEYGLSALLFFGQCYESGKSQTNGLQLTLSKSNELGLDTSSTQYMEVGIDGSTAESSDEVEVVGVSSVYSDTVVMKNAGYWQLRANPGVWTLKLAEGSRGAEIFEMVDGSLVAGRVSIDSDSIGMNSTSKSVVMNDFTSRGEHLLVNRRPGFEDANLFYDVDDTKALQSETDDVIHVFSLATGHLYERFLKIMMLSVTKRTSTRVKFWLFENFLSPTFKASARALAESIGCEVEFVTYKWPAWLRGQSEKQRIIWGYKILFLDVLFPLNVKKIIYVDADQVVRGDLKELWDLDLEGAPYGYTPFCTSREATLGYQFWREGFWKRHLRGKPYHISALYVVDLETFRRTRVGDILRSTYQQLSADPNSLSNLDQDLPNYAQHEVPIFSLPQEWLWCESWCSDETKATAKTIDLCNNPMHKEPKVSMAKRVISGELFNESWVELDAEVEAYDSEYVESLAS